MAMTSAVTVDDVTSSSHHDRQATGAAVRRVLARTPLALRLLVTFVCLSGVAVAAGRPWAWQVSLPELPVLPLPTDTLSQPTPQPAESQEPYLPGEPSPIGRTIVTVLALLVATALAALIVWAVVRIGRALREVELEDMPETPSPLHDGVDTGPNGLTRRIITDAVDLALARLDGAATPHDAVIAAWLEFEAAASRHGVTREPTETATEFTSRLLLDGVGGAWNSAGAQGRGTADRLGDPLSANTTNAQGASTLAAQVPAEAVTGLRDLYNAARFTTRVTTPADVDAARTALRAIARALVVEDPS